MTIDEAVRAQEIRQRTGYETKPVVPGEFDIWLDEQCWDENPAELPP